MGDRAGAEGSLLEGAGHRGTEFVRAIIIEQGEQALMVAVIEGGGSLGYESKEEDETDSLSQVPERGRHGPQS